MPTPELLSRLDVPSASVNAAASTLGGSPSSGWRSRCRDDQLDRLRSILERYQHPFYGADEC